MKIKIAAVLAAVAALTFTAAGSAAAQPLVSANQREAAHSPQVNGLRLASAMLPVSAFGDDVAFNQAFNSGSKLQTTRIKDHVPSMSCKNFEGYIYISKFGDTAGAWVNYDNSDWVSQYPDAFVYGDEYVLQFATDAAAATFYGQARAKFVACKSFTEPIGSLAGTVNDVSVTNTKVSGNKAFVVTQSVVLAGYPNLRFYYNWLIVLAGTEVYHFSDLAGNNDEPSTTLMTKLIHRVQALYH
jgi:hypothetical protein